MAFEDSAHVQATFNRDRVKLRAIFEQERAEQAAITAAALTRADLRYAVAQHKAKELQAVLGSGYFVTARRDGSIETTELVPRYKTSAEARAEGERRAAAAKRQSEESLIDFQARRQAQFEKERTAREALVNVVNST